MGKFDDEDDVYCTNCEKKILQDKAIYVGGKPYCKTCYRDAEEYETIDVNNEEEEDNDEDDDEDDDDDDDDEDDSD